MTYALPDEPRGAIRPDLAVSALWPLLTLMLIGPLAGFAWLAFNSWALGCRHALRHTLIALVMVPGIGVATLALAAFGGLSGLFPGNESLAVRLSLIAVQAIALGLAFWIMWDQDDAEQWRKTFGEPIGNGAKLFFPLLIARVFLGSKLPALAQVFVLWVGL